jgi:selenoprotein W-related protein
MSKPRIEIQYCPKCRWLPRASWLSQELLWTFEAEIGEVALIPAESGTFKVIAEGNVIWDRKLDDGFPQAKELKQRVRDAILPDKDLGHAG